MSSLKRGASLQNGKYIIGTTLGQGGFGITYEAEQVSLGRKVAVKEFFMKDICNRDEATSHVSVPSVGSKELVEKFRAKFIKEARMLAGYKHPSIVKVHDVFEENGTAYYVMEYLEGGSLQSLVKSRGKLGEVEALRYIKETAEALGYIHSRHTLHLDVKPGNIMLDSDGRAVLIDFGISKHIDSEGHLTSSTPLGISKGYAPFEQVAQEPDSSYSAATDIYSLGATLYFLLTGKQPYDASAILKGLPTGELEEAGVSRKTIAAISATMKVQKDERPQSVEEFLKLLDAPVSDDEETIVPVSPAKDTKTGKKADKTKKADKAPDKPKPSPKPFPKWLYGLFAGIAVAVLAVVLINRPDRSSASDNPQAGSSDVVVEAVPEKPAAGKPSASASKPESPAVIELKSISLSKSTLELEEGSSATLTVKYNPNNATDKATTWKSTDVSIAKVSSNGKVTAVKAGSAAIFASCQGKDAYCNVTVKAKEVQPTPSSVSSTAASASTPSSSLSSTTGTHSGHEWVDLGLGVKWATCNVGASSPEGYGSYFAWGETSPKSEYTWSNLKYCNDTTGDSFSKYNQNQGGTRDNRTVLELSDDAARANWGGSWRMPTNAEFQELIDNCTWTWTTMNGKNGYKVVSKSNGNSIFLPAAGWRYDTSLSSAGSYGSYWSSSLYESRSCIARGLFLYSDSHAAGDGGRRSGQSVRPVFR